MNWQREIARRLTSDVLLKASSTIVGIGLFFVAYFWALRNPIGEVTTMPVLALDSWFSIGYAAMPLYLSLWFYVSLGPALLPDRRALLGYGIACGVIAIVGLAIFIAWPTKVPPLSAEAAQHIGLATLRGVDLSGNACPSLHVAFAVFAAFGLARELRGIGAPFWLRMLNLAWCVGIVYSTLATRQHVVLDVIAGAALGALVALLHAARERSLRRRAPLAAAPRVVNVPSVAREP